tara:strand:+ start:615 stop:1457 length:843 start_codon:yes stop_codon:yes gene_type:complete
MTFSSGQVLTAAQLNALDITSLVVATGSEGSPSISFSGDSNTGFFQEAGDQIDVGNGGEKKFSFDNYYLKFFGNSSGAIRVTPSSGREILELRSGGFALDTGAGYNLYGDGDSSLPNYHVWFTGTSSTRMALSSSGLVVVGSLSKSSGSFDIPHPTKGGNWRLRHSFIEGPTCDNIYRGTVTLTGGSATVNLDTVSNMTAGTFEALNKNLWSMVSSSGNAVTWSLSGKTLTINGPSGAECNWMVIGERKDQAIIDSDMTDEAGELIVEYERTEIVESDDD